MIDLSLQYEHVLRPAPEEMDRETRALFYARMRVIREEMEPTYRKRINRGDEEKEAFELCEREIYSKIAKEFGLAYSRHMYR